MLKSCEEHRADEIDTPAVVVFDDYKMGKSSGKCPLCEAKETIGGLEDQVTNRDGIIANLKEQIELLTDSAFG